MAPDAGSEGPDRQEEELGVPLLVGKELRASPWAGHQEDPVGGRARSHQAALTSGPGRPGSGTHEFPTSLWGSLTKSSTAHPLQFAA